jgi:protein-tyrosine phosphatase
MDLPRRLLFVCSGNVCRSTMAELLWRKMAAEKGLRVEARSCGTAADGAVEVPGGIWKALEAAHVPRSAHTPRLVSEELLSWADVALTMTRGQRMFLAGRFPAFSFKLASLTAYAGLPEQDIEDPTTDEKAYAPCRAQIQGALMGLMMRY